MIVVLTGAPGAGKGTQADLLVERQGYKKISTGDALRNQIKGGTELGKTASQFMEKGELVPDALLLDILKSELSAVAGHKVLLDGYPRNLDQAKTLEGLAAEWTVGKAIHLDVESKQLVERLSGRRTCLNCGATFHITMNRPEKEGICDKGGSGLPQRPDDEVKKVQTRLTVYEKSTEPVLDFYRSKGVYVRVDGLGSTEDVYSRLLEAL